LDVPWRVKLLLPAIAALPMLLVYYATFDITFVVVPKPLRPLVGQSIDLGMQNVCTHCMRVIVIMYKAGTDLSENSVF